MSSSRQIFVDSIEPQTNDDRLAAAIQAAARARAQFREVVSCQALHGAHGGYIVITVVDIPEEREP